MVDVTEISAIVAAAGVLVGVVYYILDMRNQARQRQTNLVMSLYSQFNGLEFQRIWHDILNREVKNYREYNEKYGWAEFTAVGMFFEGIGILLKRKLTDIELIDDMFTMPVNDTWLKMKDIVIEIRKIRNRPTILEWFEYLYNEMRKREQRQ